MSALSPDHPVFLSGLMTTFALNRKISDRRRWPQRSSAASRTDALFWTLVLDWIAYGNSRQGNSLRS